MTPRPTPLPPPDLPVVVLGLMGAGKTSVGRALAARWSRTLRDSDADIEHASGRSAAELAHANGPDVLHDLEAAHLLTALVTRPAAVVSAAASVVDRGNCLKALQHAFVIWLDLSPDVLARRFATGAHRPRYGPDPAIVLRVQRARRGDAFASVADLTIRDDTLPVLLLADEVESRIGRHHGEIAPTPGSRHARSVARTGLGAPAPVRSRTPGAQSPDHPDRLPPRRALHMLSGVQLAQERPTGMSRPRVAITRASLPGTGLDRLAARADVVRWDGPEPPEPAALRALVAGAHALLCLGNDRIDGALLDAAGPSLQAVALASMGFDAVDQHAAAERGVVVSHTPGVLAETTADLAFSLILMARRRLVAATDDLRAGGWTSFRMDDYLGLDVHGATVGIVGYGQIGRALARRAHGFGMRVLRHDPHAADDGLSEAVDFATLLAESDVVSLHVPLTPQTRHLIGAPELAAMKPTATLVNTSRGGVVDENALLTALRLGQIHSAGLDVFETEPLHDSASPLLSQGRLVVLPHVGSATEATRAAMVDLAVENLLAVLTGRGAPTPLPGTSAVPRALSPADEVGARRRVKSNRAQPTGRFC